MLENPIKQSYFFFALRQWCIGANNSILKFRIRTWQARILLRYEQLRTLFYTKILFSDTLNSTAIWCLSYFLIFGSLYQFTGAEMLYLLIFVSMKLKHSTVTLNLWSFLMLLFVLLTHIWFSDEPSVNTSDFAVSMTPRSGFL